METRSKTTKGTLVYFNNTPLLYVEEQDDVNTKISDSPLKYIINEEDINRNQNINKNIRLNSTNFASADVAVNGEIDVGDKSALSSIAAEKNSSFNNMSGGVSSLFDSTNQQQHLENELDLLNNHGSLELNPTARGVFFHILEKMEILENNLKLLNEKLQSEINYNIALKNKVEYIKDDLREINNKNIDFNNDIENIIDELYQMEIKIIENNQYTRRESIIISGIPDNISQIHLEEAVIRVLRSIGLKTLSSYNISACHRLRKNKNDRFPARTIVRFTNRKLVAFCLENRNRLLEVRNEIKMNLRIYESLCDSNEQIYKKCFNLKKYGLIKDYYIRNGFVKLVLADNNRIIKIKHPDDLYHYFSDYYDSENLYN